MNGEERFTVAADVGIAMLHGVLTVTSKTAVRRVISGMSAVLWLVSAAFDASLIGGGKYADNGNIQN